MWKLYFLNKNNIKYQRPKFTIIKPLKYRNQKGLSCLQKIFSESLK